MQITWENQINESINPCSGLFHKIIIQSGSSLSSWAVDDEPVKSALSIAKFLKCQSQNLTEIAKCFQTATVDDLIKAHAQFEVSFKIFNIFFHDGFIKKKKSKIENRKRDQRVFL